MEIVRRSFLAREHPRLEIWGVRLAAILTGAMGAVNLFSAVFPALQSRLLLIENTLPLEVRHGSRLTSVLAGFALFLLAGNLWRRKRLAWLVTTVLLGVSVVTHLLKGLDYEEAGLSLGLLIFLVLIRSSFHAYSDPPSLRQGLVVLAAALAFTLVYGTAGFFLLDRHFSVHFGLLDALRQTIVMFTSFYNPGLEPVSGFGRYFAGSIYVIGLATLTYALIMLVRPVLVRYPASAEEHRSASQIVQGYGHTPLARAALFDDKSYFFSPGGSVLAFAVRGRGALVLGDPIGLEGDALAAIVAFRDHCGANDWQPAFLGVRPEHLAAYHSAGFETLCVGNEAVVDLKAFTLEGSQNKNVRNAVTKISRLGYSFEVHLPPLGDRLLQELRQISDAWLTMHHGGEMHFADGWFDDDYIRNGPVAVVHAPDGRPIAFANLVSEYQENGLTIDLMRRYREVESGTMEFLFASMLAWARDQGYEAFSLGLSAMVGVGEKPDDPRMEQTLRALAEYVSRFYNFRGLHDFKEKFNPRWEPRYLAYLGPASLPLVLTTLLRTHSGDNFLWKYLRK
jgi:phosphatidylglycerol lysyltransferase